MATETTTTGDGMTGEMQTPGTTGYFTTEQLRAASVVPGAIFRFVAGERLMALHGTLEPNASLPLHSHPHEQITYVLTGSVAFQVGDERREMRPGDGLVILGGVMHGAVQVGDEGATIFEIFTPIREEYAKHL